jgi:hypothetical protein
LSSSDEDENPEQRETRALCRIAIEPFQEAEVGVKLDTSLIGSCLVCLSAEAMQAQHMDKETMDSYRFFQEGIIDPAAMASAKALEFATEPIIR